MVKKRARKAAKKTVKYDERKFRIAWKNFLFFLILSIISLVLYNVTSNTLWTTTFGVLWIILGFVSVAFLLVVLIFLFLKSFKK